MSDFSKDSQTKKESHSWKKSTKNLSSYAVNNGFGKEDILKKGETLSASTLSLYIEAFENSNETNLFEKEGLKENDLIKKGLNAKQIDWNSTGVIQNVFEFSRQQESGEVTDPEIAHFSASQQLLSPAAASVLRSQQQQMSTVHNLDTHAVIEGFIYYCLVGCGVLLTQIIGLVLYLLYLNFIAKVPENDNEKAAVEKDEEEEFISEAEDDDDDEQTEEEPKQK